MIIEILQHTPFYVYWMFISLITVGLMQRKTRTLSVKRALGIPLFLCVLSIFSFYLDFSFSSFSIRFWIISFFLVFFLSIRYQKSSRIEFIKKNKTFVIKGSYIPLIMMMLVFFTKYFVGVLSAQNSILLENLFFIASLSFLYGFFTASFFLRFYFLYNKLRS